MFLGNQKVLCQSDSRQNDKKTELILKEKKNLQVTLLREDFYCNYVSSPKQQGGKQPKIANTNRKISR